MQPVKEAKKLAQAKGHKIGRFQSHWRTYAPHVKHAYCERGCGAIVYVNGETIGGSAIELPCPSRPINR